MRLQMCQLPGRPVGLTLAAPWNLLRSFKDHLRLAQASRVFKLAQGESSEQLGLRTPALDREFLEGQNFYLCTPPECHSREQLLIETGNTWLKVLTESSYGRVEITWALTSKICLCLSVLLFSSCVTLDTTGCLSHL